MLQLLHIMHARMTKNITPNTLSSHRPEGCIGTCNVIGSANKTSEPNLAAKWSVKSDQSPKQLLETESACLNNDIACMFQLG